MLAYIWNEYKVFPGDVYNRDHREKLFIYAATRKAIEAKEAEIKKMERQNRKGGKR